MDNFKDSYLIIKLMYEGMSNKKMSYDDFIAIFPKITMIIHKFGVSGYEMIRLIDLLLEFRTNNLLERINNETIDFVNEIYCCQEYGINIVVINKIDILRHLLLPYKLNICEKEDETYAHFSNFECLYTLVDLCITINPRGMESLRKYNIELYETVLRFNKYKYKINKNNKLAHISIIHLISAFYFKQDEYDKDYSLLDQIIGNISKNEESFKEYCNNEGITLNIKSQNELNNMYRGLINLLDEGYRDKKGKRNGK